MRARVAALLVLGLPAVACAVAALDYTGKTCPCPAPWTCNAATNLCENVGAEGGAHPDGGAADAGPDATTDSPVAPGADAEAGTSETGPTDAGLDAATDATWCRLNAPDAFYCCDFDEGGSLLDFVIPELDPDGSSLDTTVYESTPHSLRAASPSPIADGGTYAAYVEPYPWSKDASSPSALHLGFHLLVSDLPAGNSFVTVSELGILPNGPATPPPRSVQLIVHDVDVFVQEQLISADGGKVVNLTQVPTAPLAGAGWQRVTMDLAFDSDAGPGTCLVTIGPNQKSVPLTAGWTSATPALAFGLVYANGPLPDASVNVDNVTLDIH
jgi:hypothetical protein